MEEKMSLVKKLAEIRKMASAVKKDKRGYNYSYSDITDILAKVTSGMKKYSVTLIPGIVPGTAKVTKVENKATKFDRNGKPYENTTNEMLVTADMTFTWVNDDDPSDKIVVPWFVTGSQQDPSQAFGSGLTYCTRYFLYNYFQTAQTEMDVDEYRSKQREAEAAEQKAIADDIIASLDLVVRNYLAGNQGKAEEVKAFFSEYVKGGNYKAVKDPRLAAKMMEEFKNKFEIEED